MWQANWPEARRTEREYSKGKLITHAHANTLTHSHIHTVTQSRTHTLSQAMSWPKWHTQRMTRSQDFKSSRKERKEKKTGMKERKDKTDLRDPERSHRRTYRRLIWGSAHVEYVCYDILWHVQQVRWAPTKCDTLPDRHREYSSYIDRYGEYGSNARSP